MIKVGYFCTSGYTELGGLPAFLSKIRPSDEVKWVRCFPKGVKPDLKRGRTNTTPVTAKGDPNNVSGYTGDKLVEAMLDKLKEFRDNGYWDEEKFDYLLLIDDADCRFNGEANIQEALRLYVGDLQKQVDEVFQEGGAVPLLVLFASPEAEAWLVADWQNSFRFSYKAEVANALHHHLHSNILCGVPVESYGGAPIYNSGQAACTIKLSNQIIASFQQIPLFASERLQTLFAAHPTNRTYNKQTQGGPMLGRIDPEVVAKACTIYFAPVFRQLKAL